MKSGLRKYIMATANPRWKDWLKQAENELLWARDTAGREQHALGCFLSQQAAQRLDQYYISTRYPDSHFSGAAFEYFTAAQAAEAIQFAETILSRVRLETAKS